MPDAAAGGAAFLNGQEIVNDARTMAYLEAGYGPTSLRVSGGCACPRIRELIECNSDPYASPSSDPAPWYDASVPESADFAGFLTTDFEGLGSTYTRTSTDKITGGAVLGRLRPQPRTLTWKGLLFGRSDSAVQFGLRWLTANLRGTNCACGGEDLDILVSCPETVVPAVPVCGPTSSPSVWTHCPSVNGAPGWVANIGPVPEGYTFPVDGSNSPNLTSILPGDGEIDIFSAGPSFDPCTYTYNGIPHVAYYGGPPIIWQPIPNSTGGQVPEGPELYVVVQGPNYDNTDPMPTWSPSSVLTGYVTPLPSAQLLPLARPEACPPFTQPDAFRQLKNVGLIDGPKILSQRRMGCTSSCGNSSCTGDTLMIEVQFSLMAGNPYLFGCSVCLAANEPFPINEDPFCNWHKVFDGGDTSSCGADQCPPSVDCTVDIGCPEANLPDIPAFKDRCFCDPIDPVQFCCPVPADSFGQFFDGAPVIEIYSGSKSMRATTIRFFNNPQGRDCCTIAEDPCLNCDSLQIRFIPANSTMVIDGTTRTVTVQCPGMGTPILADHLTVTPFAWPMLQCADFCICVETEGAQVATDATVTVLVTPREM